MRYRGACSQGKASVIWRAIQSAVGLVVTLIQTKWRRWSLMITSRHNEQINRTNMRGVIAQKGLPALRWRPASSDHVFGHGRVGDREAQLEQLAVDARRSP